LLRSHNGHLANRRVVIPSRANANRSVGQAVEIDRETGIQLGGEIEEDDQNEQDNPVE
jgi:hypothetical protein